jgi:NADP-dependent 3-hydroxy acid dehydrogenase YdfG
MKVEGKIIIFTGAGSGLGLECVHRKDSLAFMMLYMHAMSCMADC